jgi:FKBP-type peptidyl-prolyl cis-trans isomerase FkpA
MVGCSLIRLGGLVTRTLLVIPFAALMLACSDAEPARPEASAPSGAAAGGLEITHLREGSGPSPTASDTVKVHYHGTFPDGRVFDSSVERGVPASFPLGGVIACWTEGLQQMKVGGRARLTCPPALAYGEHGAPPTIPPNSTLIFEVELLEIQ